MRTPIRNITEELLRRLAIITWNLTRILGPGPHRLEKRTQGTGQHCQPFQPPWRRRHPSASLRSARACAQMPVTPAEPADYVLLHRDTGTALYRTRATEAEIHQANRNLSRSGNRNRYVAARHLPHHQSGEDQS
jgi:hypothetical protein